MKPHPELENRPAYMTKKALRKACEIEISRISVQKYADDISTFFFEVALKRIAQ